MVPGPWLCQPSDSKAVVGECVLSRKPVRMDHRSVLCGWAVRWARQSRPAGVLRVVPGMCPRRKGRQRLFLRKYAGACGSPLRGPPLLAVSLVGSRVVIRSNSGRSRFLWQRIDGGQSSCALHAMVFTVRFGLRYAYEIGGGGLGM